MRRLSLEPLSAAAFEPFGDVIDARVPCEKLEINEGRTRRHHALAAVDCGTGGGTATLSLFRAQPVDGDFLLRSMERHPLGSQAFINTARRAFAVVVAPAGDLDESLIRGFLAGPEQSINYHRGVWHHYLLALAEPSDFVVVDRTGPGDNCDEQALSNPLQLVLEP